ncbi:MAG: tetratricopeptide repeat protein, partial [Anaerolineales bacterium]
EAFNEVIALQSGNAAAYYGRAVAEALIGEDMEQVIVDLRQAITLDETYRKRALEEPAFALIIDIEGLLTAERLFDAGQTGEREGTLEDAIQYYLEAIKLDPVNDTYHAALAEAYTQLPMPNWNEAERAYLRAIELSVDNDNYYFKLAEVYAAQGKYEQAIESLETAIELKGDKAIYYDRLSAVLFKSGLLDEALIAGEAAIDLEPENLDYRFHLAEIYRQIESWDQAKTYYDQIIEVDPEYGDAHCGLAIVQYQTGDGEGATAKLAGCMALSDNQNLKDQTELARTTFELRQDGSDDGD